MVFKIKKSNKALNLYIFFNNLNKEYFMLNLYLNLLYFYQ